MISRRMIACAGTATCRLGLCLSQNLLGAVDGEIRHRELDQAADIRIHISGCPNSCGRHPIADIGLFGAVRRLKDRLVPSYVLQLGGRGGEKTTRLAEGCEMIPARAVPALVGDLIEAFRDSGAPSFGDWILDAGKTVAEELAEKYRSVPSFEEAPEHYHDWGANELFSLAGRGPGECSAGVFDLIELDLANAATALHEDKLGQAIDYATRALLITQGVEARDPSESRSLFIKHFIDAGLAPERFKAVVAAAATPDRDAIADLIVGVRKLYDSMDDSLRFKPVDATKSNVESSTPREAEISPAPRGLDPSPASCGVDTSPAAIAALEGKKPPAAASATAERSATPTSIASPASSPDPASTSGDLPAPDREMDLRGVTCPLNYVRTKMTLAGMKRGEILAVLLDEQGARNVPQSAEGDGHAVLGIIAIESHWRVLLRKDG
jgi:sulfite reductase (ferredoxin)